MMLFYVKMFTRHRAKIELYSQNTLSYQFLKITVNIRPSFSQAIFFQKEIQHLMMLFYVKMFTRHHAKIKLYTQKRLSRPAWATNLPQ